MIPGATRSALLLVATAIATAGCSKDEPGGSSTPASIACSTVCIRCGKPGSVQISGAVANQSWPAACASCGRHGAYPAQACGACGKDAAMLDARTRGYGEPAMCPHCGKPWKAPAATRPPG